MADQTNAEPYGLNDNWRTAESLAVAPRAGLILGVASFVIGIMDFVVRSLLGGLKVG
jgi:hypothetical protein